MKSLMKNIGQVLVQALVLPADVSMEFSKSCQRGEQLDCQLTIKSQASAIDVERISITLMAEENVEIDAGYQSGYASEAGDKMVTIHVGTVTDNAVTVNKTITVSDAISLEPNRDYAWKATFVVPKDWKATFVVPKDCNATYHGVHAHHIWYLNATIALANRKLLSKKNFSYKWDGLIVL